jgi:hypothetical protein
VVVLPWAARAQIKAPPQANPGIPNQDDSLREPFWAAAQQVVAGVPWQDIGARLADEVSKHPEARHAPDCTSLLHGLSLAAEREPGIPASVGEDSTIEELIAALPHAQIDATTALSPFDTNAQGEYRWEIAVARHPQPDRDPAILLFRRGRDAIPSLVEALSDDTVTRTAYVVPTAQSPIIFRVGDLSLSIIQAISHCWFHEYVGRPTPVSEESREEQDALAEKILLWLDSTHEMSPTDAVLWHIDHDKPSNAATLLVALVRRNERAAVGNFLRDRFRKGDDIEPNLASLLVETGSRAPLDYVAARAAQGVALSANELRFVVSSGQRRDFESLRAYIRGLEGRNAANTGTLVKAVIDALRQRIDVRGIPALMAALDVEMRRLNVPVAELERTGPPLYLDDAAQHVQRVTGINFGHRTEDAPARRLRAIRDMLAWWQREGESAYALSFNQPYTAGGIR